MERAFGLLLRARWALCFVCLPLWAGGCGEEGGGGPVPRYGLEDAYVSDSHTPAQGACSSGRIRVVEDGQEDEEGECEIVLDEPELPRFEDWACPEGWIHFNPRDVYDIQEPEQGPRVADFQACRPPEPRLAPSEVPLGQRNTSTSADPVPIGPTCPEPGQRWPQEAQIRARAPAHQGQILYVDAAASPGGEGTRQAPFSSAREALDSAEAGDIVILGTGEYLEEEPLRLERPLALLGSCVAQTSLLSLDRGVEVWSGDALLSGFGLESQREGIWVSNVTSPVTVRGVEVRDAGWAGVGSEAMRAQLVLEDVSISTPTPGGDRLRFGVRVENNASAVTLRDVWVHGFCNSGVFLDGVTQASMERVRVEDIADEDSRRGCTTGYSTISTLSTVQGAVFIGNAVGVEVSNLAVEDVAFRGLYLNTVQDYNLRGVWVRGVELIYQDAPNWLQYAVQLFESSNGRVRYLVVEDAVGGSVMIRRNFGVISLQDVVTHGSQVAPRENRGEGVVMTRVSRGEMKRVAAFNSYISGVGLHGFYERGEFEEVHFYMEDIWTSGSEPTSSGNQKEFTTFYGVGLQLFHQMDLRGTRILTENNRGMGVQLSLRSYLDQVPGFLLTDVTVRGTRHLREPSLFAGRAAAGVSCYVGCDGILQRARIEDSAFGGVVLHGDRARLIMEDVTVQGAYSFHSGQRRQGGAGVVVMEGATLSMDRFRVSGHELLGFKLIRGGHMQLRNGDITDTETGMDLREFEGTLDVPASANVRNRARTPLAFNPADGLGALELFALVIEEITRREEGE